MTGKKYHAISDFDEVSWSEALLMCADSPWVQNDSVVDNEIFSSYLGGDDWFPGNVPIVVTENTF